MPSQFPGEIGYSKITASKLKSYFNDVTQRLHGTTKATLVNTLRKSAEICRKNEITKQIQTKQNQIKRKMTP